MSFIEQVKITGDALHSIPSDVWALCVLVGGVVTVLAGHKEEGQMLIGGALALFRGSVQAGK